MMLKNYYELLALCVSDGSNIANSNIKDRNGNFLPASSNGGLNFYGLLPNLRQAYLNDQTGVFLGTGRVAPTFEDYSLSGDLITDYDYTSTLTRDYANHSIKATYTITNTSGEAFTIGEVAVYQGFSGGGSTKYAFIERTLLDNPVTIPAGGVGQVEYTIQFNVPSA